MGIYTLTEALKEACGADSIASVQIAGVNVHQTTGYQSIQAEEQRFWATFASLQNPAPADSTLIETGGNHDLLPVRQRIGEASDIGWED